MFFHNFKYSFRTLFKNKMLIFWTFLFPIILGTLFSFAFSDIEKNEMLDVISIALVGEDSFMKDAFFSLSEGEEKLFAISDVSLEEAQELLSKGEITGYVELSFSPHVVVASSGINETVLKTVTETIMEETSIFQTLLGSELSQPDFDGNIERVLSVVQEKVLNATVSIRDESPEKLSYTMIEFYTLIAMTCLYGGILTMTCLQKNLANMSSLGKRVSVTPLKKSSLIFSSVCASFLTQLIGLLLLFLYTIFVLHVDYGSKFFSVFLLSLIGSFAGLAMGCVVSVWIRGSENTKLGVLLAVIMLGCFFSGMMGITMKYVIDTHVPILNILNPASMITDGFYALYYYETNTRFLFDVGSLLVFSIFLLLVSMSGLRRQCYDSI